MQLFKNDIIVEGGSGQSSQAYVFFGREKSLKIRVVLKQYKGQNKKSILSEIKIFTLLENLKKEMSGSEIVSVINKGNLVGLPHMLGYKVSKSYSEIMMTHGGNCLEKWTPRLPNRIKRVNFAADMLRQIIMALKTLHSLGYSHGDLKPENVCVRESSEGRLKFTLIDFGLCQKLHKVGEIHKKNKYFRGNFMFCSDLQLKHYRPTQFCDLISLLSVAFYVVHKDVPSTMLATRMMKENPGVNLFDPREFKNLRIANSRRFEKDLCSKSNPFHQLCLYLHNKRDYI